MSGSRTMIARMRLTLTDLISGPLAALQRRLTTFRAAVDRFQGGLTRIGDVGQRLSLAAGVVAGLSFAGPVAQAARLDQTLRDNAITAGQVGVAVERMIGTQRRAFQELAFETSQRTQAVAEAGGVMIAAGMDASLVDRLLPTVARVATGANAAIQDIARSSFSLAGTLAVPADQLERGLAALVLTGREGRFELRAMAREIPALSGAMLGVGATGFNAVADLGAMLQVAMVNAGSESEAANNLRQFIARLSAPDFVREAEKMGLIPSAVRQDALRRNINPVEAMVQAIGQVTRGDPQQIAKLLTEQQSRDFFMAMHQNRNMFRRIQGVGRNATTDVIQQSLEDQSRGLTAALTRSAELTSRLGDTLGNSVGRVLTDNVLPPLERFVGMLEGIDRAYPGRLDDLVRAFGLLATAGAGLAFLGVIGKVLGIVTAIAGFLNPAGAIALGVAALTGAGIALYNKWKPFRDLIDGIASALGSLEAQRVPPSVEQRERLERFRDRGGAEGFYSGPAIDPDTGLPAWPGRGAQPGDLRRPMGATPQDLMRGGASRPSQSRVQGRLEIGLARGLELRSSRVEGADVVGTPDRGQMLTRP